MRSLALCLLVLALVPDPLHAGHGADRTVVVVNAASPTSLRVAHHYQRLRDIPDSHMIYLTLDVGYQYGGQATATLDEAIHQILGPVWEAIDSRDLVFDVDAIVYSTGFPYVIDIQEYAAARGLLNSTASLTGITYFLQFLRRDDPAWLSPTANAYFRGGAVIGGHDLVEMDEKERELSLRAYREYKAKRYRESSKLYAELLETYRGSPEHWYNQACSLALIGVQSQALDALEQAVARGWSDHYWTRTDKDLAVLRASPRFTELLEVMRARETVRFPSRGYRTGALWSRADDPQAVPVWDAIDSRDGGYYLSMMLGYSGQHGNTVEEVLEGLARGAASDGTHPEGTVSLVRGRDKRLRARMSQHEDLVAELAELGQEAEILVDGEQEEGPALQQRQRVVGAILGSDTLPFDPATTRFLPGAVVDNLTPWGGAFWSAEETKLTDLLRHGAVASSGPVTESDITIAKYAVSRVLAHLRRGCTVAESYYQSVSAPYQLLLVGDPLARPFARGVAVSLQDPGALVRPRSGQASLAARVAAEADAIAHLELSVDGRQVAEAGPGEALEFDTAKLTDGAHRGRITAVLAGPPGERATHRFDFQVDNHGRFCELTGTQVSGDLDATLAVSGTARGAQRVELRQGNRTLATAPVDAEGAFVLEVGARHLGVGICQAHVVATAESGEWRSDFVSLEVLPGPLQPASAEAGAALPGLQGAAIAGARRQEFAITGLDPLCTWPLYEAAQDVGGSPGTRIELRGEFRVDHDGLHELHFYSTLPGEIRVGESSRLVLPEAPLQSRCLEVSLTAGWHRFEADLTQPAGAFLFQCFVSGASPGAFPDADHLRSPDARQSLARTRPRVVMSGAHARDVLQDGQRTGEGQALASGTCVLEWKRSTRNLSAIVLYPVAPESGETACPTEWVVERKKGKSFVRIPNLQHRFGWDGSRGSRDGTSPAWIELSFSPFSAREIRIRPATDVAAVRLAEIEAWVRR